MFSTSLFRGSCFKPVRGSRFCKCYSPFIYWISPQFKDSFDLLAAVTGASRWFALLQIADLGVASFKTWSKLTKEEHNEQRKAGGSAGKSGGTLHYMAPEHLNDVNSRPSEKSDVFSFAIVLWAIFANKEPYESKALIEEGAWGLMGVVSGVTACSEVVEVYHCLFNVCLTHRTVSSTKAGTTSHPFTALPPVSTHGM